MRPSGKTKSSRREYLFASIALLIILSVDVSSAIAGKITANYVVDPENSTIETGLAPFAAGSDSVRCGGDLLARGSDYTFSARTGILLLLKKINCDSLQIIVFRAPDWLTAPEGNAVPQGQRLISVESISIQPASSPGTRSKKITLTGNKSFSFAVGRTGAGQFSQGLNLDFDALIADDLQIRGSVADKIGGAGGVVSGSGGTSILSELDKYFFEIEGRRVIARGGDIETASSRYLPDKRIRGMAVAYTDDSHKAAADIGRPAGKFISQKLRGEDGRQGPYQAQAGDGLPTGVVPGSEKVYVDGRLLEGGSDKHYEIEYASGRITFSPIVLITSRSRIEIDFEAAETDFEQAVYDLAGGFNFFTDKLKFEFGARRETDEKDRLRYGSFSDYEIAILQEAGDSSALAYRSGVSPDTGGDYVLVVDPALGDHYEYVGGGNGGYSLAFSAVGENKGAYRYLGDGIYEYVGMAGGDYLPIVYLPLPERNDYIFGALDIFPYRGGTVRLAYQGNIRDNNLLSTADDDNNFKSQLEASVSHQDSTMVGRVSVRFRQDKYNPVSRLDLPDFKRVWALPSASVFGDEFLLETLSRLSNRDNRAEINYGYLSYKDNIQSRHTAIDAEVLDNLPVSPRVSYRSGNSKRLGDTIGDGLYERINPGVAIKAFGLFRLVTDYDRELSKNRYDSIPLVEKYTQLRTAAFYRNTVLTVSRRTDFESTDWGVKGPRLDKVEMVTDESLGRLKFRITGTLLDQKRLDSDREDRRERLYQTSINYVPSGGWLTLQADYRQNRQSARSTDDLYLKVESGEGNYRLEDGEYLYDPDGDYIRIEEETGGTISVSTGEKSHNITLYPGRVSLFGGMRAALSQLAVRLRTQVTEKIPGDRGRKTSWILPWTSRSGIEYLLRSRREGYSVLLFPSVNFYILNFSFSNLFFEQEAGEIIYRSQKAYELEIKNSVSPQVRTTVRWRHDRDDESGVGLTALALRRDEYSGGLVINQGRFQMTPSISYSRFTDDLSGGEGRGVWIGAESVYRQPGRGEIRFDLELRSLTEKKYFSQPEYLVTDGKRFGQSARINLVGNYDLGKAMRLTVNLTDLIYKYRAAEFTGRGELIARF